MGVRFPLGVLIINFNFMENNNDKPLTEEEIAQMDALFGFGGCNCSTCDHGCHDEAEEETEEDK